MTQQDAKEILKMESAIRKPSHLSQALDIIIEKIEKDSYLNIEILRITEDYWLLDKQKKIKVLGYLKNWIDKELTIFKSK